MATLGDGAAGAAIQATGLVHPHLARASQTLLLDQRLAMLERLLRAVLGAAVLAIGALIQAKEDVALVVLGGGFAHGWQF